MAKKDKAVSRAKVVKPLKVSKAIKTIAALGKIHGVNAKQVIRSMGEAEQNFKDNGYLILS